MLLLINLQRISSSQGKILVVTQAVRGCLIEMKLIQVQTAFSISFYFDYEVKSNNNIEVQAIYDSVS